MANKFNDKTEYGTDIGSLFIDPDVMSLQTIQIFLRENDVQDLKLDSAMEIGDYPVYLQTMDDMMSVIIRFDNGVQFGGVKLSEWIETFTKLDEHIITDIPTPLYDPKSMRDDYQHGGVVAAQYMVLTALEDEMCSAYEVEHAAANGYAMPAGESLVDHFAFDIRNYETYTITALYYPLTKFLVDIGVPSEQIVPNKTEMLWGYRIDFLEHQ